MIARKQRFGVYFMMRYWVERKSLDDPRTTVYKVAKRVSLQRVRPLIGNQWRMLPLRDSQTVPAPGNAPEVWP